MRWVIRGETFANPETKETRAAFKRRVFCALQMSKIGASYYRKQAKINWRLRSQGVPGERAAHIAYLKTTQGDF